MAVVNEEQYFLFCFIAHMLSSNLTGSNLICVIVPADLFFLPSELQRIKLLLIVGPESKYGRQLDAAFHKLINLELINL